MLPGRWLLGALALLAPLAAPVFAERARAPRISAATRLWLDSEGFRRAHLGARADDASSTVPVTIRLRAAADTHRLLAEEDSEIQLVRNGLRLSMLGAVVSARVTRKGLDRLGRLDFVTRVELDSPGLGPLVPLAKTAEEVEARAVGRQLVMDRRLTGHGVTIADIDTGIDVFHPAFLRADGGYFDWIDVDGDGQLTPGIDCVDRNGNGAGDTDEVLGHLDRRLFNAYAFTPLYDSGDEIYQVGDWLFQDENGSGKREDGPGAGFTDDSPSLGEPLFVADDVDGNGVLDRGEKLVLLGSSKIRATYDGSSETRRGENLIDTPGRDEASASHGTQAAGIAMGGIAGLDPLAGIAPDAELLMARYDLAQQFSPLLTWAVDQGADVILHEYAPWFGYPLDGSTNHELMMDAAAAQGVLHANPTGNLGGSDKHAVIELAPQAQGSVEILIPGGGYQYVGIAAHWRHPERDLALSLESPSGEIALLGSTGTSLTLASGTQVDAIRETSTRLTARFEIYLTQVSPEQGDWILHIADLGPTDLGEPPAEISLYVVDDRSGWDRGVRFTTPSEKHLVGFPSTADSAIGVAAYSGRGETELNLTGEPEGNLRRYSCRGTRLDGAKVIDLAAPDNPLTPTNEVGLSTTQYTGLGTYRAFGGTSGAGAHVAGALALLAQALPDIDADTARALLAEGAAVDDFVVGNETHTRDELWGAGKLRIHAALFGGAPPASAAPVLRAETHTATPGQTLALDLDISDADTPRAAIMLSVDLDYDGSSDLGPVLGDTAVLITAPTELGTHFLKVMATDPHFNRAAILVELLVEEECTDCEPPKDDAGCGCKQGTRSGDWGFLLVLAILWRQRSAHRSST